MLLSKTKTKIISSGDNCLRSAPYKVYGGEQEQFRKLTHATFAAYIFTK